VQSRELSLSDGIVLMPAIAVILFMALYPQLALHRSEKSVKTAVASAHADATQTKLASSFDCNSPNTLGCLTLTKSQGG
jgi:NADH-quinone oxidoreductase subunit M